MFPTLISDLDIGFAAGNLPQSILPSLLAVTALVTCSLFSVLPAQRQRALEH